MHASGAGKSIFDQVVKHQKFKATFHTCLHPETQRQVHYNIISLIVQMVKHWKACNPQPFCLHDRDSTGTCCLEVQGRAGDHWPCCSYLCSCVQNTYPAGHSGVFISSQSSSTQWVSPTRKCTLECQKLYIYMWTQVQASQKMSKGSSLAPVNVLSCHTSHGNEQVF